MRGTVAKLIRRSYHEYKQICKRDRVVPVTLKKYKRLFMERRRNER